MSETTRWVSGGSHCGICRCELMPVSGNLWGRGPAACVMSAKATGARVRTSPLAGPLRAGQGWGGAGLPPTELTRTSGGSPSPSLRLPPPQARLCHHSLPARPGRTPPLCRWGRLLPVAETNDIFISLSKPPLFMEVSPS